MTIAHDPIALNTFAPLVDGLPALELGSAGLLPGPAGVRAELERRVARAAHRPRALVVLGLLRRDDTWPTSPGVLDATTALVARTLRGDDWLGRSGPAEFAVLLDGSADDADAVAARLTAGVAALGSSGLGAGAGIAVLEDGVAAGEVLRRATLSLSTARSAGAGTVVRYRGVR
ncbi:hypothetical protein [Geodermatophilus sp. FMUSA9-8]|uniref:hypothetical protein n=1 Tax=Geodermatophilus sp. FMUSA9-8 TaxID=3120155 RepID=UPI003009CCC4